MKKITLYLFAIIGILNASAFGFPSIGDSATYDVAQQISGQTIKAEMVTLITAINRETEMATVITTVNGLTQSTDEKALEEMEGLYNLIDQCSDVHGTLETISAANMSIKTCLLHQELNNESGPVSGDIWFGKVPFGIVKSIVKQSSSTGTMTQTMTLKSFKGK